jgi:hypothetical protein
MEEPRTAVFPRVLWLVRDERRRAAVTDMVARQPSEVWTLFAVALLEDGVERVKR